MDNGILHYRSVLAYNAEVFLIQKGSLAKAFMAVDENFDALYKPISTMHDPNGHSHVSFIPFLFLIQRQARAAFELFSRAQSYQGWVLVRPAVESALIIGKWADNPQNAKIWRERLLNRQAYRDTYEGKALRSQSMANSSRIQPILSKINTDFVHANPSYYDRHLRTGEASAEDVTIEINYIDDGPTQETHVLAFTHLVLLIQQDLADLFSRIFGTSVTLPSSLALFTKTFESRIAPLTSANVDAKLILSELGGWDVA